MKGWMVVETATTLCVQKLEVRTGTVESAVESGHERRDCVSHEHRAAIQQFAQPEQGDQSLTFTPRRHSTRIIIH